jgi:hypothetical protein
LRGGSGCTATVAPGRPSASTTAIHGHAPRRRRQQLLAQRLGEARQERTLGGALALLHQLVRGGGEQHAVERVRGRLAHEVRRRMPFARLERPGEQRGAFLVGDRELHAHGTGLLAAAKKEQRARGHLRRGPPHVGEGFVRRLGLLARFERRDELAAAPRRGAHRAARLRVIADQVGDEPDETHALVGDGRRRAVRAAEGREQHLERLGGLAREDAARDRAHRVLGRLAVSLGRPRGAQRARDVLEQRGVARLVDDLRDVVGQSAGLLQEAAHALSAARELALLAGRLPQLAERGLRHPLQHVGAVAGEERRGIVARQRG